MNSLHESLFISIFALLYALLEIEIEGEAGWGKNLPTPKILFEFTQYHIIMILLVSLIIFKIYYKSKKYLLFTIFVLCLWFILEDTYWFIFNKYYTLNKYNKENVPWHRWFLGLPYGSWISIIIIIFCYLKSKDNNIISIATYTVLISIFYIIIAPLYHQFYNKYH